MEITYSKILVPYDHSPSAQAALMSAIVTARAFKANLDVCYVVGKAKDAKTDVIGEAINELKAKNPDVNINFMVRDGKIYKEVKKLEEELSTNLIIMGTHGSSGMSSLIGSNAFKVVSTSNCPTMVMGENATNDSIGKILLPLDNSQETRQKVPFVVQFAKGFNAEVVISCVSTMDNAETKGKLGIYVSQTEDYLRKNGVKYTVGESRYGGNLADNCIELAKSQGANVIAMMTETESSGLFMGTFAQQLINKAEVPILAIHTRSLIGVGAAGY